MSSSEPVHDGPVSEHPSVVAAREADGDGTYGIVVIVLPRRGDQDRVAVAFGPLLDEQHAHDVASAAALGGAPTFWVDLDQPDGSRISRYRHPLPDQDGTGTEIGFSVGQGRDR